MAFFRNSAVNLLNLHYGVHCITLYGGGAFFLVYVLKAGLSLPGVLVLLALILVGRLTRCSGSSRGIGGRSDSANCGTTSTHQASA